MNKLSKHELLSLKDRIENEIEESENVIATLNVKQNVLKVLLNS